MQRGWAWRRFGILAEAGKSNVLLRERSAKRSKSFFFFYRVSRRGLVTNDTLFCRHPAGDKDRGLKINCKTKTNNRKTWRRARHWLGGQARRDGCNSARRCPNFRLSTIQRTLIPTGKTKSDRVSKDSHSCFLSSLILPSEADTRATS